LPKLAKFYLDEELALPSVDTWWCGQDAQRDYVFEHLDELVVRHVRSSRALFAARQGSLVSPDMLPTDRARLVREIERKGYDFLGQKPAELSSAPVWA